MREEQSREGLTIFSVASSEAAHACFEMQLTLLRVETRNEGQSGEIRKCLWYDSKALNLCKTTLEFLS